MRTSILFVLANLRAGGAERTTLNLVRYLAPSTDIHLAAANPKGPLLQELPRNVELHKLGGRFFFLLRLTLLARRLQPSVIFSTLRDLNIITVAIKWLFPSHTKIILREACSPNVVYGSRWFRILSPCLYRALYSRADIIIAPTNEIRTALVENIGVPADKIEVIYNAVDTNRLAIDLPQRSVHKDTIDLISIGRLDPQKGYDLLLESIASVRQTRPNVRVTIYGEGKERRKLQKLIRYYELCELVSLPGYIEDPIPALTKSDLYIMCSRFEGLSNAMLEALCNGLPVVAMDLDTSASEFIQDGVNGFLITECTPEDIASGILRAIKHFRKLKRDRIAHKARNSFSIDTQMKRYRSLLIHNPRMPNCQRS